MATSTPPPPDFDALVLAARKDASALLVRMSELLSSEQAVPGPNDERRRLVLALATSADQIAAALDELLAQVLAEAAKGRGGA